MQIEPPPQRDSTWTSYIVLFSLIILVALWVNLSDARQVDPRKSPVNRWEKLLEGDASARLALAAPLFSSNPVAQAQQAAECYTQALPWPAAYRRLGITKQVLLSKNGLADLEQVASKRAVKGLSKASIRKLRQEVKMWRVIYGSTPLTESQLREFIPRVQRLNLGPLKEPAIAELYARAGMAAEASAALKRAQRGAFLRFTTVALIAVLGAAASVVGLFLLGRSTRLLHDSSWMEVPSGAVFGGFTAYLACVLLLSGAVNENAAYGLIGQIALNTTAFFIGFEILRRRALSVGWDIGKIGLRNVGFGRAIKWGLGGYCVALPVMLFALDIAYLLQHTIFRNIPTPQHPIVTDLTSGGLQTLLAYVLAVLIAPVIEETFFRGALYTGLRARMSARGAALFSGVIFAAIHPTLPLGFLPILALSIVLAGLREKTGSVYPGMVCHALNNAVMLTLVVLIY